MIPALVRAVVRLADAQASDAELLGRFVRSRDSAAFEELVHRHGPLVWSVCRQLLPNHADAEDAFQAVFLALVQGSARIRAGEALPAWLHGVAIRAAEKIKRSAVRQRQREGRAAAPEHDHPVPDSTWAAWMNAVHEEVQRLPDLERAAFILCELEGVRQPDAAVRLGWPLGTVSGRLCKARQRLIDRLSRRGILPGMLAIGGLAGTAGMMPAMLVNKVLSFPSALADGVSSTVATLAHGLAGGVTMRMKLIAATLLVAGAVGLTGGTMVLSNAEGQTSGQAQGTSGSASSSGQSSGSSTGQRPGNVASPLPNDPFGNGAPGMPPGGFSGQPNFGPGMPGMQPGAMGGQGGFGSGGPAGGVLFANTPAVEYKFVDLATDDRDGFVQTIKKAGAEGWEFCGSERFPSSQPSGGRRSELTLVLVFKKHKAGEVRLSGGFGIGGGGFNPNQAGGQAGMGMGMGGGGSFGGGNIGQTRPGNGSPLPGAGGMPSMGTGNPNNRNPQGRGGADSGPAGGAPASPATARGVTTEAWSREPAATQTPLELKVFTLKHSNAADLASVLSSVFATGGRGPGARENFQVSAVNRTNQLIVRATPEALKELDQLLKELDVPMKDSAPSGSPRRP